MINNFNDKMINKSYALHNAKRTIIKLKLHIMEFIFKIRKSEYICIKIFFPEICPKKKND